MSVKQRQKQWVEVGRLGNNPAVRIQYETYDPGDGLVPAIWIGDPRSVTSLNSQLGQQGPSRYLISVEDLREIVRLADEDPKSLGA